MDFCYQLSYEKTFTLKIWTFQKIEYYKQELFLQLQWNYI